MITELGLQEWSKTDAAKYSPIPTDWYSLFIMLNELIMTLPNISRSSGLDGSSIANAEMNKNVDRR